MTSRYSKALPPTPPSSGTPRASAVDPLLSLANPDRLSSSPDITINLNPARGYRTSGRSTPPPIPVPSPLRPSPPKHRPYLPSRLRSLPRVLRKTVPRPDVSPVQDYQQPSSNSLFPASVGYESSTASFSAYPGRKRDPASNRVPVPLLGEYAVSRGGFLDEMEIRQRPPSLSETDKTVDAPRIQLVNDVFGDARLVGTPGSYRAPIPEVEEPFHLEDENAVHYIRDDPFPQPNPQKRKGAVRFKLAGVVARGVQKMSAGVRGSVGVVGGSGSRPQSAAIPTPLTRANSQRERITEDALHAGPGGLFEPDFDRAPHPVVRTLLQRAASSRTVPPVEPSVVSADLSGEQPDDHSNISYPINPRGASGRQYPRPDPRRRQASYRTRNGVSPSVSTNVQPQPSIVSHEGEPTTLLSHERTQESGRPLLQNTNTPPTNSRRGGAFRRLAVGMDIFREDEDPRDTPSSSGSPIDSKRKKNSQHTTALGSLFDAFLHLPLMSKTHVTVSYIPAVAKPDGTIRNDPWYTPKVPKSQPKNPDMQRAISMSSQLTGRRRRFAPHPSTSSAGWPPRRKIRPPIATMTVLDVDPRHRARYVRQDMLPGIPVQVFSDTSPPILIAPDGATYPAFQPPVPSPSQPWFSPPLRPAT